MLCRYLERYRQIEVAGNCLYESLNAAAQAAVDCLEDLPFANFYSLPGANQSQLPFVNKPFS